MPEINVTGKKVLGMMQQKREEKSSIADETEGTWSVNSSCENSLSPRNDDDSVTSTVLLGLKYLVLDESKDFISCDDEVEKELLMASASSLGLYPKGVSAAEIFYSQMNGENLERPPISPTERRRRRLERSRSRRRNLLRVAARRNINRAPGKRIAAGDGPEVKVGVVAGDEKHETARSLRIDISKLPDLPFGDMSVSNFNYNKNHDG